MSASAGGGIGFVGDEARRGGCGSGGEMRRGVLSSSGSSEFGIRLARDPGQEHAEESRTHLEGDLGKEESAARGVWR